MPGVSVPSVVRLLADPVRWRLMRELASSDRRVRELAAAVGQPQNLVSYHLRQLRLDGLVSARRSSADARGTYYTVDLGRFGELLAQTGRTVHPGLRLAPCPTAPAAPLVPAASADRTAARLLFLCTGNSARSQIAEALAVARSGGRVEAHSAGSCPKPLHPNAVRVLRERGIEVGLRQPKHLSIFVAHRFDYVITMCDKVREVCPEFPGHPGCIHWSIPDPAASGGDDDATLPAFRDTAAEVERRLAYLLAGLGALPGQGPA